MHSVDLTDDVQALLDRNAPVGIGVSGGKDSAAVAFAVKEHLATIGHTGPQVLVHADLGRTEWKDSLPTCERISEALELPLQVVRRKAGDMMARWEVRWENNVNRYRDLECVKLILPWSTPSMRFCTSEMKTAPICQHLVTQFPGEGILNVTGIRAAESPNRAKKPISKSQAKLTRKSKGTYGLEWNAIHSWPTEYVYEYLAAKGFELHEAYTKYQSSRVSCVFCILQSAADRAASAACPDNADVYRLMVDLEIRSTFAFQSDSWLGDTSPDLLDAGTVIAHTLAKRRAKQREDAEALIPPHLLYVKGWPTVVPTLEEAKLLSEVRNKVADAVGLAINYTKPHAIVERYEELIEIKKKKTAA